MESGRWELLAGGRLSNPCIPVVKAYRAALNHSDVGEFYARDVCLALESPIQQQRTFALRFLRIMLISKEEPETRTFLISALEAGLCKSLYCAAATALEPFAESPEAALEEAAEIAEVGAALLGNPRDSAGNFPIFSPMLKDVQGFKEAMVPPASFRDNMLSIGYVLQGAYKSLMSVTEGSLPPPICVRAMSIFNSLADSGHTVRMLLLTERALNMADTMSWLSAAFEPLASERNMKCLSSLAPFFPEQAGCFLGMFGMAPVIVNGLGENGMKFILNALSSTTLSALTSERFLGCISNAVGANEDLSSVLVDAGAFLLLQPSILSSSLPVSVRTAFSVATIGLNPHHTEALSSSGMLPLISDVLRQIPPGTVTIDTNMGPTHILQIVKLLEPDVPPPFKLAALHRLIAVMCSKTGEKKLSVVELYGSPQLVAALREVAACSDAFLYICAAWALRWLDHSFPVFKGDEGCASNGRLSRTDTSTLSAPTRFWDIETVCLWVGAQPFKMYRQLFRDSFVSGRVLLKLSDSNLVSMGINNEVHRIAILDAVEDLKEKKLENSVGIVSVSPPSLLTESVGFLQQPTTIVPAFDVFISYRRAGGADFAQLLKILLQAQGMSVFLDTDNLGTGRFADSLVESLSAAKNILLVWTKGCMDKFLGEAGTRETTDFVRLEYFHSLRLKKIIVPVYKEDFQFPGEEELPSDIRGVLHLNAIKWVGEYRDASLKKVLAALTL